VIPSAAAPSRPARPIERLLKLAFACLFSLEQPRVLDGDDGLVGERLEELDLTSCEWSHPLAGEDDRANHVTFAQEGHGYRGAVSAHSSPLLDSFGFSRNLLNVRYVNGCRLKDCSVES
jgi:hypothetical protein